MSRRRAAAALPLLALFVGCAAAPAAGEAPVEQERQAGDAALPLWSEQPGAVEDDAPPRRTPPFRAPGAWPRPSAPGDALGVAGARLAVAAVRSGDFTLDPEALLALAEELLPARALEVVVALSLPGAPADGGGLEPRDLLALAREQRRDLLLLELSPGRAGQPVEALLFACADGRLLAEVDVTATRRASDSSSLPEDARVGGIAQAWRRAVARR